MGAATQRTSRFHELKLTLHKNCTSRLRVWPLCPHLLVLSVVSHGVSRTALNRAPTCEHLCPPLWRGDIKCWRNNEFSPQKPKVLPQYRQLLRSLSLAAWSFHHVERAKCRLLKDLSAFATGLQMICLTATESMGRLLCSLHGTFVTHSLCVCLCI